jgi:hypothetical protein
VLAALLYVALSVLADGLSWREVDPQDWVGHVGLNAIAISVILHVGVGRRWPFARHVAEDLATQP